MDFVVTRRKKLNRAFTAYDPTGLREATSYITGGERCSAKWNLSTRNICPKIEENHRDGADR